MPTPVDQATFADLLMRFQTLVDQWAAILKRVALQELSGPGPFALSEVAHGGKALLVANGSAVAAIVLVLPKDAAVGALFLADQAGPGPVRLTPAEGATLRHRVGHNGSAGQWASISAKCIRNVGGGAAEWLLAGDTAVIA